MAKDYTSYTEAQRVLTELNACSPVVVAAGSLTPIQMWLAETLPESWVWLASRLATTLEERLLLLSTIMDVLILDDLVLDTPLLEAWAAGLSSYDGSESWLSNVSNLLPPLDAIIETLKSGTSPTPMSDSEKAILTVHVAVRESAYVYLNIADSTKWPDLCYKVDSIVTALIASKKLRSDLSTARAAFAAVKDALTFVGPALSS